MITERLRTDSMEIQHRIATVERWVNCPTRCAGLMLLVTRAMLEGKE